MRKDEHVYVIHIARVADTVWPGRSNELTIFTELKQFWSGFEGETNTAVHRRVLDRPFLAAAGRIHTEIEHNARASRLETPAATPAATQNTPGRHHQPPQPQQHQQHQPHQRDIQRQREQMEHVNTTEAIRRSLADEHGDEDEAIARSIVDEVARQHQAAGRDGQTSLSSTPAATPATTQVRKDSGGLRGEGSATSLDPKTLPRVSGNRNQSAPRDCDRTRHPLSDTHRVMRNASQRGERESRTRLDGPLKAPCGDGTPEGGAQIKGHGQSVAWSRAVLPLTSLSVENQAAPSQRDDRHGWNWEPVREGDIRREGQSGERTNISTVRQPEGNSLSVSGTTGPGPRIPHSQCGLRSHDGRYASDVRKP